VLELNEAPVIGQTGPRHDGIDAAYWEGLAAGELRMQRCDGCDAWRWGPVWRCADCGSWDLTWRQVEPVGTVYSWIRTHQAFVPALADAVPFVNVLVELPHAGSRRMLGVLVGPEEGLRIGAPVRGVFQQNAGAASATILRWRLDDPAA
jgi:uncharacterized OB-fold protein